MVGWSYIMGGVLNGIFKEVGFYIGSGELFRVSKYFVE